MGKEQGEQFQLNDSEEIKRMISERSHFMDIESLHLAEAQKARANIDELTHAIADSRALDEIRPYGRTYTSLDLPVPVPVSPLNEIFAKILGARKLFKGR